MLTTKTHTQPTTAPHRAARIAANAGLIGLWLWLYRPVFDYLAIIFAREDFRTNQIVLIGVAVLIAIRVRASLARGEHTREGRARPRFDAPPQLYVPALAFVLGGSALYLVVERFLDINTLSASLFGLASYGLLGLWMAPARWREGLPAALLLLIGALPFGEHLQTFVGYPMRILTATLVRDGLAGAGVASVGVDTILVLENGVSQVDVPCSGVKSLWTGALFLIAATWIERRRLNLRWMLTALAFVALLRGPRRRAGRRRTGGGLDADRRDAPRSARRAWLYRSLRGCGRAPAAAAGRAWVGLPTRPYPPGLADPRAGGGNCGDGAHLRPPPTDRTGAGRADVGVPARTRHHADAAPARRGRMADPGRRRVGHQAAL